MNKYIKISAAIVFLLSILIIFCFRSVPKGQLWKNYIVLYADKESDNSKVMDALESAGIKNTVTLSNQFLPAALSENSIEISMLRLNYKNPDFSYLTKRNSFFFDKSEQYRLYYIPIEYKQNIGSCLHILNSQKITCGTDADSSYPYIIIAIIIILSGILFYFTINKIPFACGIIVPLIYLLCNPFYPVALSSCLIILCLFFIANLWRRKDLLQKVKDNKFIMIMGPVSFLSAFSASLFSGFIFILTALGTLSALLICYFVEDFLRNQKSFVPVYIRSAKRLSLFADKAFICMTAVCASALLLIAVLFLTSSDTFQAKISKLLLPAASSSKNENLPQLEEYYRWMWNVKTYPYKSINKIADSEDKIVFPDFVENPKTGLIESRDIILTYDTAFKQTVFDDIENLNFNSVEKVMKSEGDSFIAGYTSASNNQINLFGIIMSFICLLVLLFIYFSIIIRKGINK